jgi:hypothetical protein
MSVKNPIELKVCSSKRNGESGVTCYFSREKISRLFLFFTRSCRSRRMDEMTLHTVFYDWLSSFMERREELEEAAGKIFGNSRKMVLRNTLASLRYYAEQSLEAKAKIKKATEWMFRSVLVKAMLGWHVDAQATACQKRKVEAKRQQVLYKIANRCVLLTFTSWVYGSRRRKHVAALADAALRTLQLAIKKGAFARLRSNVMEVAHERSHAIAGAIAWSVAVPGKISMWPTLFRNAKSRPAGSVRGIDLTQEAADSLAAFGKDNFNSALLQGLEMGASFANQEMGTPSRRRQRRHKGLSPLRHPVASRHMGLRPDSEDDEEGEGGMWSRHGAEVGRNIQPVACAAPLTPIGTSRHSASTSHSLPLKTFQRAPAIAPFDPARSSGQYIGALSNKQLKVR